MMFQQDLKNGSDKKIQDLIRHVILTSLLKHKKKFGDKYGEMIICTDGKKYWRKEHFQYYKAGRKKSREKSDLNWSLIFDTIDQLKIDLNDHFPYKVIGYNRAEADDIIAVLTEYFQTNELIMEGLVEETQPILILSSDHDNIQLHKYNNVKQYSSMQQKFVVSKVSPQKSLIDKICTGDAGDGIPNILSSDDVFITEGVRQKPFRKTRLEEFYNKGIDACQTPTEKRNYQRNELLVSYEKIPEDVKIAIINEYKKEKKPTKQSDIMNYFIKHRCRLLMNSISEF